MKEERCVIIDINATNISCVYVKKGPNGTFLILKRLKESMNVSEELKMLNKSVVKSSGVFIENKVENVISNFLREIKLIGPFNKNIIVGIADEFCSIRHVVYDQGVTKHRDLRKTLNRDMERDYKKFTDNEDDYRYFSGRLIKYNEFEKVFIRKGRPKKTKEAQITYSLIYCKTSLYNSINEVIKKEGYKTQIVLKSLACLKYHLSNEKRENAYLAIHTQDKKSTLLVGGGEGIYLKKFSNIGLDNIIKDIMENIKEDCDQEVTKEQIKDLVKNVILTLNDDTSSYTLNKTQTFSSLKINGVIKENLQKLLEDIKGLINSEVKEKNIRLDNKIYFYGSGITEIKGLKNYMESLYGGKIVVEVLRPQIPQYEQSRYCNITALINSTKLK